MILLGVADPTLPDPALVEADGLVSWVVAASATSGRNGSAKSRASFCASGLVSR
jgi:hypothetical protein